VGPSKLGLNELVVGLFSNDTESVSRTIIWDVRAPRVGVSFIAGASLGLAGVLIQLSTRSPLGDPNLFGIGGGAAMFMAAVVAGLIATPHPLVSFVCCLGSATAMALLLSRCVSSKGLTPIKLAVMGIATGAMAAAVTTSIVVYGRVFPTQIIGLVSGSFTASNWEMFWYASITLALCLLVSIKIHEKFYPIILGDILAKSLGVNPPRIRTLVMIIVGTLAGSSVYIGGLIGFIGLLSPHVARRLFGNNGIHLIFGSSLCGALLLLASDQISRLLFSPSEIPVGMVTVMLGAPMMIYLGWKMK